MNETETIRSYFKFGVCAVVAFLLIMIGLIGSAYSNEDFTAQWENKAKRRDSQYQIISDQQEIIDRATNTAENAKSEILSLEEEMSAISRRAETQRDPEVKKN